MCWILPVENTLLSAMKMSTVVALWLFVGLVAYGVSLVFVALFLRWKHTRYMRRLEQAEPLWLEDIQSILILEIPPFREVSEDMLLDYLQYIRRCALVFDGEYRETVLALGKRHLPRLEKMSKKMGGASRAWVLALLGTFSHWEESDIVREALLDDSPWVRVAALGAMTEGCLLSENNLGTVSDKDCEAILEAFPRLHKWGHEALVNLCVAMGSSLQPALVRILSDLSQPNWVRMIMIDALIGLRDLSAAGLAEDILAEGDRQPLEIRCGCIKLIGELGDRGYLPLLEYMCREESDEIIVQCAQSISRLANEDDKDLLERMAQSQVPMARLHAMRGLCRLSQQETVEVLANMEGDVGVAAREVLGETKGWQWHS